MSWDAARCHRATLAVRRAVSKSVAAAAAAAVTVKEVDLVAAVGAAAWVVVVGQQRQGLDAECIVAEGAAPGLG